MKKPSISLAATLALAATPAAAQSVRFSIDLGSSSIGAVGYDGSLLEAGTILHPEYDPPALGPLNPPGASILPAQLGLTAGTKEVDALSHGRDARPNAGVAPGQVLFSVDRNSHAQGTAPWANVRNERPEASSDAFVNVLGAPVLPAGSGVAGHHAAVLDGNGLAHPVSGHVRGGLGLAETGDRLDGIDHVGGAGGLGQLYFSLDPAAAAAHGALPGDVLVSNLGGGFGVYVSAAVLGLDQAGAGLDDVDALAVWDNGDNVYEPPADPNNPGGQPYQWGNATGDMVLFSVTRGSAIIGALDSHFGLAIQPGDVLTVPEPLSPISGNPAIVLAAERLYLQTDRAALVQMDELDALDVLHQPLFDCNGNGVEDAVDIASGAETDADQNSYPDSCQAAVNYCTAGTTAWGCQAILSTSGYASATASNGFAVTATNTNGNVPGLFFFGTGGTTATPWGATSSFKCVASPVLRTGISTTSGVSGACGSMSRDLNSLWCPTCPRPGANPGVGSTVRLQAWFRDLFGPIPHTALSDAIEFHVLP